MNQELPPWALVKVWLDIQSQDTPQNVKDKRLKMLTYYFGSIKSAIKYVEENDDYQRAS
tara:strand:+ start:2835 stop:3011 length:177 start_codon:yes stop_codon:yes gene_type:complete